MSEPTTGPDPVERAPVTPTVPTRTEPTEEQPTQAEPTRRRRETPARRGMLPVVAAAGVAGLVGGLGGGVLADQLTADDETTVVGSGEPLLAPAAPAEADGSISGLSRAVLPSVALISIGEDGEDGLGSGFVVREDGYVLTNHHVIQPAVEDGTISVELPGRAALEAEVVGSDAAYDIAVLKVAADDLVALPFADSDALQVGQTVVAVGAPLGLDSTVTSGIVSALDRPVVAGETRESASYISAVQTDAAINPGNSGGPLLDLAGGVVGVNSAIAQLPTGSFGGSPGSIGLGFAIPAEQAERTAAQLIETGTSEHPVMGVLVDLSYTGDGARVLTEDAADSDPVIDGGPADWAGVRPGDIIVSVDGTVIRDTQHLLVVLRSYAVGDTVEMVLQDDTGEQRTVSITLAGSGE